MESSYTKVIAVRLETKKYSDLLLVVEGSAPHRSFFVKKEKENKITKYTEEEFKIRYSKIPNCYLVGIELTD